MPQSQSVNTDPPQDQSAAGLTALIKPKLRGVSHQYAACVSVPAGLLLTLRAPSQRAAVGSLVYTASLVSLFSISALYHQPTWQPHHRKWMRRLDHAAIFFLIAGTYTPICLLALPDAKGDKLLLTVWTGALLGVAQSLLWVTAPKTLVTGLYLVLGWAGVQSIGQLRDTGVVLVACGGFAYTCGALAYALKWPNPAPRTFGYHEIFHALVIVASIFHFTAVARLVLGAST
ncbi:hypothetical protein ABBQ38_007355 [Trebouxia sp. C0009 RCD-2024]